MIRPCKPRDSARPALSYLIYPPAPTRGVARFLFHILEQFYLLTYYLTCALSARKKVFFVCNLRVGCRVRCHLKTDQANSTDELTTRFQERPQSAAEHPRCAVMQLGAGDVDGGADEGWRLAASGFRPPPVGLDLTMSKLQSQEPSPLLRSGSVCTPTPEGQGSRRPKVSKVWSTHMPREVKVEFKKIRSATYDHSLAVELPASPDTRLQVDACTATSCRQPLPRTIPPGSGRPLNPSAPRASHS